MGEKKEKAEKKEKGYKVKTFVTEVKIFQTMKELRRSMSRSTGSSPRMA